MVVFTGDAGFWYHIGELETQVRWNIPTVTLVNNNGGGNQSKRGFDRVYGGETDNRSRELWTYRQVNFAKIAEDIGALGIRVEKPNEIASALAKAIDVEAPNGHRRRDRHRGAGAGGGELNSNLMVRSVAWRGVSNHALGPRCAVYNNTLQKAAPTLSSSVLK